jgi:hypothetical protein
VTPEKSTGEGTGYAHAVYDFLFVEHSYRHKSDLVIMLLTVLYCVYNDALLERPAREITYEALGIILLSTAVSTIWFWLFKFHSAPMEKRPDRRATKPHHRKLVLTLRTAGALAVLFILVGNKIHLDAIEPAIAARHLQKTDIGLISNFGAHVRGVPLDARFRQVSNDIDLSLAAGRQGNPYQLREAKAKLEDTFQSVRLPPKVANAATDEVALLQGYENFSLIMSDQKSAEWQPTSGIATQPPIPPGHPLVVRGGGEETTVLTLGPGASTAFWGVSVPTFFTNLTFRTMAPSGGPQATQFAIRAGTDVSVTSYHVTIEGFTQEIEGMTWLYVTFKDCVIQYDGQRVYLGGVRFIRCKFEFTSDSESQRLRQAVDAAGESALTFVSPE